MGPTLCLSPLRGLDEQSFRSGKLGLYPVFLSSELVRQVKRQCLDLPASLAYGRGIWILPALVMRRHTVHREPDCPKPELRVGCGERVAGRDGQAASLHVSCAGSSTRGTAWKGE